MCLERTKRLGRGRWRKNADVDVDVDADVDTGGAELRWMKRYWNSAPDEVGRPRYLYSFIAPLASLRDRMSKSGN